MRAGPVQRALLLRAGASPCSYVYVKSYRELRAMRALARRLKARKVIGLPRVWEVTW